MQKKSVNNANVTAFLRLRILLGVLLGAPIGVYSAEFTVNDADELQAALLSATQNSEKNQIRLNSDIQLKQSLPALKGQLSLDGQGYKINALQQFRVFTVVAGEIQIKNLDIVDGKAEGKAGGDHHYGGGGGGAAGMGGGLFIQAGKVHLDAVHFVGNQALGGVGGHYLIAEGKGVGGDGAAFDFAPVLAPEPEIKNVMTATKLDPLADSPYALQSSRVDGLINVVVTPEPEMKHIAQAAEPLALEKVIYRQGGIADNSGGTGANGDFGSGGGGGGNGVIDGGFGGTGGFGGGGGGGGYGFGFIETYDTGLKQNDLLDHGDNRGAAGFAAGFGGLGGFADNSSGGSGGGGAGLGGAIFIQNGELKLEKVKFSYNLASGGAAGEGQHKGSAGAGRGGALFICAKDHDSSCGALVRVCDTPSYTKNIATSADPDVVGELLMTDCTPPPVLAEKTIASVPLMPLPSPPNRKGFRWEGERINAWALWLGGNVGKRNIYDSGRLKPSARILVDNLPLDGSLVFSRLWFTQNGQDWHYRDYRYDLSADQWLEITEPSLLVDNADNVVYGKQHRFRWQGSGIKQWRLSIGRRQGGTDVYYSGNLNDQTEALVDNLPADGSKLYIRLWFWQQQSHRWQTLDYQYSSQADLMDISAQ